MSYKNKEDQAKSSHKHYFLNKKKIKSRAKEYTIVHRIMLRKYINEKKNVPCLDCHESYPSYVMDFDHKDKNKEMSIGTTIAQSWSLQRVIKEMEKCDIVCSNCHRERTHKRFVPATNK